MQAMLPAPQPAAQRALEQHAHQQASPPPQGPLQKRFPHNPHSTTCPPARPPGTRAHLVRVNRDGRAPGLAGVGGGDVLDVPARRVGLAALAVEEEQPASACGRGRRGACRNLLIANLVNVPIYPRMGAPRTRRRARRRVGSPGGGVCARRAFCAPPFSPPPSLPLCLPSRPAVHSACRPGSWP